MYLIVILSIIIDWSIVFFSQDIDRFLFIFSKKQKSWTEFRNFVFIDFSRTWILIFKALYFKFIDNLEHNTSSVFCSRSLHIIFLFDFVRASTPSIGKRKYSIVRKSSMDSIFSDKWRNIFKYEEEAIEYRFY